MLADRACERRGRDRRGGAGRSSGWTRTWRRRTLVPERRARKDLLGRRCYARAPWKPRRGRSEAPASPSRRSSLGGEGILRTHGRERAAVTMIHEALRAGVRYCDTAPAYDESQEYYGAAFRSMEGARDCVFLASEDARTAQDPRALAPRRQACARSGPTTSTSGRCTISGRARTSTPSSPRTAPSRPRSTRRRPARSLRRAHRAPGPGNLDRRDGALRLRLGAPADQRRGPGADAVHHDRDPLARRKGMGVVGMKVMAQVDSPAKARRPRRSASAMRWRIA